MKRFPESLHVEPLMQLQSQSTSAWVSRYIKLIMIIRLLVMYLFKVTYFAYLFKVNFFFFLFPFFSRNMLLLLFLKSSYSQNILSKSLWSFWSYQPNINKPKTLSGNQLKHSIASWRWCGHGQKNLPEIIVKTFVSKKWLLDYF